MEGFFLGFISGLGVVCFLGCCFFVAAGMLRGSSMQGYQPKGSGVEDCSKLKPPRGDSAIQPPLWWTED